MHHRLSHATRKVILVAVAALAILVAATVGVVTASTTGIIFACVNVSSGTIHIVMPLDTSTSSSSSSASTATATTTTTGTAGTGTAGTATTPPRTDWSRRNRARLSHRVARAGIHPDQLHFDSPPRCA